VSLCPLLGSRKGFVENAEDFYQVTDYAVWEEVGKLSNLKLVHSFRVLGRMTKKGMVEQVLRRVHHFLRATIGDRLAGDCGIIPMNRFEVASRLWKPK